MSTRQNQFFIKESLMWLFMLIVQTVSATNLLFNSSFELGDKGYACFTEIPYVFGEKINYKGSPISIDNSAAFTGEKSLKISINTNTILRLNVHEVELQLGQKYSFSFYAKKLGDKKITLITKFASVLGGWRTEMTTNTNIIIDGDDWRRYGFSFVVTHKPQYDHEKYYVPYMIINPCQEESQLWLDGIQLEQGEISDYAPAGELETAVYAPALLAGQDQLEGQLQVISYQKKITDQALALHLEDDFFGTVSGKQEYRMDLPAGKSITRNFTFAGKRFGSFRINCVPCSTDFSSACFIRVAKPSNKVFGKGFQPGMQAGCLEPLRLENNTWGNKTLPSLRWNDNLGAPGNTARLVRLSGSTFAHPWGSFTPFYIGLLEPEQNKFNWELADQFITAAEQNSLAPVVCIPSQSLVAERSGKDAGKQLPDWLRDMDRSGNPKGMTLGDWKIIKIVLPPPEIIEELFTALAKRYGNRVKAYQLFPEANGYMQPKHLIEYMKAASKGLKKTSSESMLIALTPTEDFTSEVEGFFSKCLALEAANYCDVYAVHPYRARMDDSPVSAMSGIRNLWKIMETFNAKKPLWDTELYFLLPTTPSSGLEDGFTADALARRLLIDMGEGLSASCPLHLSYMIHNPLLPHQSFYSVWGGSIPSDRFAVFSAAARFATGAEPVKTLELPHNVLCYVFQNDGKYFSAIWSIRDKATARLALPQGVNAVVYDIFGNEIKAASDKLELVLDRRPQYIEWRKTSDAAAIIRTIETAVIESEKPFAISSPRLVRDNSGRLCCGITIRNETTDSLEGTVRISSKHLEHGGDSASYGVIPSNQRKIVLIPVELKPDAPEYFDIKVLLSGKDRIFSFNEKLKNIKQLEVKNGTWTGNIGVENILFNYEKNNEKITSPRDFAAAFTLSYSENDLLIKVKVSDDQRSPSQNAKAPWEGDCVELFLDLKPLDGDLHDMTRYHDQCFQLLIPGDANGNVKALRIASAKVTTTAPLDNIQADVKSSAGGYEMDIRLPLGNILGQLKGQCIGFTLAVNDNDGGKYKYNLTWTGKQNFMDRLGFAILYFQ